MAIPTKLPILFIGATGGCTLAALAHALKEGFPCTALVRTPSKLTTLLKGAGVTEGSIESFLKIRTGNAVDVATVKHALLDGAESPAHLPHTIISGLGGAPQLRFGLPPFTIDQPTICQDAATALVTALSEIYATYPSLKASKPLLSYVSTGGMYPGHDDVPWITRLLYAYFLTVPYKDKKIMERIFCGRSAAENLRSVITVKPTLLTDGPELGGDRVRVGRKGKPEVGYTISRKDVGGWIHRAVVLGQGEGWHGEFVTITY